MPSLCIVQNIAFILIKYFVRVIWIGRRQPWVAAEIQAHEKNSFLSGRVTNNHYFLHPYTAGLMKTAPPAPLLMNTIYLSHSKHIAEGTVFTEHTVYKGQSNITFIKSL